MLKNAQSEQPQQTQKSPTGIIAAGGAAPQFWSYETPPQTKKTS
jgi:hypothetical protein